MPKLFKSLYFQVLVAIATGIALGNFYPSFAIQLKPLGDGFIKLIKMMIAPSFFVPLFPVNIIGNTVATIVVAKWEKEINMEKAKALIG